MSSREPRRRYESDDSDSTYRLSRETPVSHEGIIPPPPVQYEYSKKTQKSKSKRPGALIGYNALVFVTSICIMTLELTASRLIAKHVGSSLYTWTSVIGVVLAGITVGNWLGGWMADRFNRTRSLAWMYLLCSVSCGSVLWLDQLVGTISRPDSIAWPQWVITIVGSIFFLPALTLGTISPLVASMALERSTKTGTTVGNVYAWGALGSIVGTFLTGFYLIDVWGTRSIIGMTAVTLAMLAIILAGAQKVFRVAVVVGWLQLLGWTLIAATSSADAFGAVGRFAANCVTVTHSKLKATMIRNHWVSVGRSMGTKFHELGLFLHLRDDELNEYRDESNYSDIRISDSHVEGHSVKSLRLDKLIHSYYDPKEPTALHYTYEQVYAAVTKRIARPSLGEAMTIPLDGLVGGVIVAENLPKGVTFDESAKTLQIEASTSELFQTLLKLAPDYDYWQAIDELYHESNKPSWGGFSAVNLTEMPMGAVIPNDIAKHLRHDDSLGILIAYFPISTAMRDELISNTASAGWHKAIQQARQKTLKTSACFYGGGGFIFPRWFLNEFPGSVRIDVAELDPAVYQAVRQELHLTQEEINRIHTTIGDARNFVDDQLRANRKRVADGQTPTTYDFIYADAFNDFSIPWHLTTQEFLQKTNELLSPSGTFQANIIDILPRTEYPGVAVGIADVEYRGRLPRNMIVDSLKPDKAVRAASYYAPLEIIEINPLTYRFRVRRLPTSAERKRLKDVIWDDEEFPENALSSDGPELLSHERRNWNQMIDEVVSMANRPRRAFGEFPNEFQIPNGANNRWVAAVPPYEFVEIFRAGENTFSIGLRGMVSREEQESLCKLMPQNSFWTEAINVAAAKSRERSPGRFLGRYVATATKVFPYVYLFSTSQTEPSDERDTFVMVCSREKRELNSLEDTGNWHGGPFASYEFPAGAAEPTLSGKMNVVLRLAEGQILTDDFAPVDNLLAPVFEDQE